jgi:hypothetical protein
MLRHTLATLAYRSGKVLRGAPADFGAFRPAEGSRSAAEILAHLGDLIDWGRSIADGTQAWTRSPPQEWDADVRRFFDALARFDTSLTDTHPSDALAAQLFQGPVADALQHVGQLAMMRRLAGSPVRAENFFVAEIAAGRIGIDQAPAKMEF